MQELREKTFVEDDYPQLAEALSEQKARVAFADTVEASKAFFLSLGLGRLTEICGAPRVERGRSALRPRGSDKRITRKSFLNFRAQILPSRFARWLGLTNGRPPTSALHGATT
jgi:hypothetical protein